MAALLRSAMTNAQAESLLREFLVRQMFARIAGLFGTEGAELRLELAAAQLVGVPVLRHILQVEPMRSASLEELVASVGPVLEHYRASPSPVRTVS